MSSPPYSFCLAITVLLFSLRIVLSPRSVGRFPLLVFLTLRAIEVILSVAVRPLGPLITVYQVNSYRYTGTGQVMRIRHIQNLVSSQSSPSLSNFVLLFFLLLRSCSVHRSFIGRSVWWQRGLLGFIVGCCLLFVRIVNKICLHAKKRIVFYLCQGAQLGNLPPLEKHVFKGINCATHTLQYQVIGVSCFISSQFLPRAYTRVLYRTHGTVSFFLPTHPPWVILFNVIGWQRSLLGMSLAVVYFLFVSLINFSPCQKANCVLSIHSYNCKISVLQLSAMGVS